MCITIRIVLSNINSFLKGQKDDKMKASLLFGAIVALFPIPFPAESTNLAKSIAKRIGRTVDEVTKDTELK